MTDAQKDSVYRHFTAGEITEGFACLGAFDAVELCGFLFKHKHIAWITRGPIAEHFWESWLPASAQFDEIMSGEEAINLLHHYFSKNCFVSTSLLYRLAYERPALLMKTIRVNRAFLNPDHQGSLSFLKDHPDPYLREHHRLFSQLEQEERKRYNEFTAALHTTEPIELSDLIHYTALWFEERRASVFAGAPAGEFKYDIHHHTDALQFFLSAYFAAYGAAHTAYRFHEEKAWERFRGVMAHCAILSREGRLDTHPVWQSLEAASRYWYFLTGSLNLYCFDLNHDIVPAAGGQQFRPLSEAVARAWKQEDEKLSYWYDYHRTMAREHTMQMIEQEKLVISPAPGTDYDSYVEAQIRIGMAAMIADHFSLMESETRSVKTEVLLQVMNGFTSNAYERFACPVDLLNAADPGKWLWHVATVIDGSAQASLARFITAAEFDRVLTSVSDESWSEETLSGIKHLLSVDLSAPVAFDRFHPFLSLSSRPFIRVNDCYIAFHGILAETNSMSSILMNLLDKNQKERPAVQKEETERMEKRLADLFVCCGFRQVLCGVDYRERGTKVKAGDFDLVLHEDGVMLYIELKRSKVRILLDEIWDELQMSLEKASRQLEKAEAHLSRNFSFLKDGVLKDLGLQASQFSELAFTGLIVSTSFEYDHRLIRNRHLKISSFELEELLNGYISRGEKPSLKELISVISQDLYWKGRIGGA